MGFVKICLPFLPKSTKVVSVDDGFVINTVSAHVVRRKPVRVEVVLPASWLFYGFLYCFSSC